MFFVKDYVCKYSCTKNSIFVPKLNIFSIWSKLNHKHKCIFEVGLKSFEVFKILSKSSETKRNPKVHAKYIKLLYSRYGILTYNEPKLHKKSFNSG